MFSKRSLFGIMFAAVVAACALLPVEVDAKPVKASTKGYSQTGYTVYDVITRYKFGRDTDFVIPKINVVTHVPFENVRMAEGQDITLGTDGMFQVNTAGLYYIHLGLDWKAQEQTDRGMRMYGIRRKAAGDSTPPNLQDERLASFDHPGADSPRVARYSGTWSPGVIPYGGFVSTEVTVGPNLVAKIGDLATANLTSVTDQTVGVTANTSLQIQARVIAANRVRVTLYNPGVPAGIVIPESGTLNVMVLASALTMGESEDAWNVLSTPMVQLNAGDKIYIVGKNNVVPNDYIQPSINSTFVQFERFGL